MHEAQDALRTILARMDAAPDAPAIFHNGAEITYGRYRQLIDAWGQRLDEAGLRAADVVAVRALDYTPNAMALIWALGLRNAISVPLTPSVRDQEAEFLRIAEADALIVLDAGDEAEITRFSPERSNELLATFRTSGKPGLIVFSSGSTGKPKGILHNLERVARKFVKPRPGWRTIMFLMFDHFGGLNTLLSSAAYGGVAVCLPSRNPNVVCSIIENSQATLLPTTPTFLNLMLASGAHRGADLSSVKLITYGTEVMPEATLTRVCAAFPNAEVKQTYGLSELGVLRSKSEDKGSTWVKIGGDGFEVQIRDNLLWIRSEANMVGYLNAPQPFDEEGWFCTGDEVVVRGDYMRILGRKSDLINVGGQKVYPAEIETILLQADNVVEAAVFPAKHPLLGQAVHARVTLAEPEDASALTERLRAFCVARMTRFKVPLRFFIAESGSQHSERFKKVRSAGADA
jgi:acyl-CoA synthetase (AMP-forming)/AMP-acid ligase II